MAGVIATIPKFQFSANGVPMVGGTLETYIAGSTTPATTWQDSALTIANTNPITLDARGECVLWLDPAIVYKFVLKNSADVIQWTQDNINNTNTSGASGASLVGFIQSGAGALATTAQEKLRESLTAKDFGNIGTGAADDRAALAAADAAAVAADGGITLTRGIYKVSSNLTIAAPVKFNPGAILKPDSGVTITLSNAFDAGLRQIFDLSAGGVVVLPRVVANVNAEWWGAMGDYVKLNNEVPINQAINALATTRGGVYGGTVSLGLGGFYISGQITLKDEVSIIGQGTFFTSVRAAPSAFGVNTYMFLAQNGTASMFNSRIERMRINAEGDSNILACIYAPAWQQKSGTDNVYIENFRTYGIMLDTGYGGATQLKLARTEAFPAANCFAGAAGIYANYTTGYTVGYMSLTLDQVQLGSTRAVITFTGAPASGATSATLNAVWPNATGEWRVDFSNGDSRLVTLTNGATTATWSPGLSAAATVTASGVSPAAAGASINGSVMLKIDDVHFEQVNIGVLLSGRACLSGNMLKSEGGLSVEKLLQISSGWTGTVNASSVKRGGASNYIFDVDRPVGTYPMANIEPYDDFLQWPPNPAKPVAIAFITGGGTPTIVWRKGMGLSISRTALGTLSVTMSPGMGGQLNYNVIATSEDSGGFVTSVVNQTAANFIVYTRSSTAAAAFDAAALTIRVYPKP